MDAPPRLPPVSTQTQLLHNVHEGTRIDNRIDSRRDASPPRISHPQPVSPAPSAGSDTSAKQKRRRNKPSLSCQICTVKKTKCDRNRPTCFACVKRRSECHYSQLADLIEESNRQLGIDSPRKKPRNPNQNGNGNHASASPLPAPAGNVPRPQPIDRTASRSSTGSSPMLLSNVPFSHPTVSNIFKAEHPFSNYWTHQGGLAEVIGVLPSKDQADILVAKYFEAVDPVYPMIHRDTFQQDYDNFWRTPLPERSALEGTLVALIFVMLAMGTQFVAIPSPDQKEQTAEFYVSASHQALKVGNYLGRPSIRSMQTMVLIIYFLMNDNHASDAFAFAGILTRHAYAMGLNRDPTIARPDAHPFEMQQRRKLWQAVLFQDTFFSMILKLPPNATHSDCRVENLTPEVDPAALVAEDGATDISYISSMWALANLVQPTVCTPRSLELPISRTAADRDRLIAAFHHIYSNLPRPFRTFSEDAICQLATRSRRLARQALFLTSNYFHCLMIIYYDESLDLPKDVQHTLDAAHEAIGSFFLLHTLFEDEARVWYHFQNRAFSEALVIGELVKSQAANSALALDPVRMRAKNDLLKMIGILGLSSDRDLVSRTRASVLGKYL